MRMSNLEEYKKLHTLNEYGFCLEVDTLKSAIILSYPYRITMYKEKLYQGGKIIITFIST